MFLIAYLFQQHYYKQHCKDTSFHEKLPFLICCSKQSGKKKPTEKVALTSIGQKKVEQKMDATSNKANLNGKRDP